MTGAASPARQRRRSNTLYQVLYRIYDHVHENGAWTIFASPTRDPFTAMRMLQQAKANHGKATIMQAPTSSDLTLLVRRMMERDGVPVEIADAELAAQPGVPAPSLGRLTSKIERRRWEIETGTGGDHDQPYRFELPANAAIVREWLRLLARVQRESDHTEGAA